MKANELTNIPSLSLLYKILHCFGTRALASLLSFPVNSRSSLPITTVIKWAPRFDPSAIMHVSPYQLKYHDTSSAPPHNKTKVLQLHKMITIPYTSHTALRINTNQ